MARRLPRTDDLVAACAGAAARHGRASVVAAARSVLADERASATPRTDVATLVDAVEAELARRRPPPPRRVVNAAGVVVHTNLGRAPLSAAARAAVNEAAGWCDLELDLATGTRGRRGARLEPLLIDATGAEAALTTNNAAAALVLVLAALAGGRGVSVSRGELVEIGGSFRLPEIMAAAGVRLVEVGTTNRTRAADHARALADPLADVAMVLVVHPSNYRVTGFTEAPTIPELAAVARDHDVPLVHDTGSGLLTDAEEPWLAAEPSLAGTLAAGADLALASGDKLLGGPQAGLVVGRRDLVERCAAHPLSRALRLDKLRIAALSATLHAHLAGEPVPVRALLAASPTEALEERSAALARALGGTVEPGRTLVGGGAAPGEGPEGPVVALAHPAPSALAARLRTGTPPILVRVAGDRLLVDLRTVEPTDDELLVSALRRAW